jgi:ribA/ribD-fused uncharacterized protein
MINHFKDQYRWLSNFWRVVIVYQSIRYTSVEHFYQAMKFLEHELRSMVAAQQYPGQAKRLAHELKDRVRPEWKQISLLAMEYGLRCKFSDGNLAAKLILTYPQELIEGNYWHDNFYGDCYCQKCTNIEGQNHLGKLSMKLREECIKPPYKPIEIPDWRF